MSDEPTLTELKRVFEYDPVTGYLYKLAINTRWGIYDIKKERAGVVGASHGYLEIRHKKKYLVHRLIWALYYNEWPKGVIDHINRNKRDNRITNLRDCNQHINQLNSNRVPGESGMLGITRYGGRFKWQVQISGRKLGYFDSLEEAKAVREVALVAYLEEHSNV